MSGGRSAALAEAFEADASAELSNAPYALSKNAIAFLAKVLPSANPGGQLFRPTDVEHIVEALLLARGPVESRGQHNLDYRRGLSVLMNPNSSFANVAEEVFHNSRNATSVSLAQFAKKSSLAFEKGATIADLIHLSDASYELEYVEKPPEEIKIERQKNLGRQGVVRATTHRNSPARPAQAAPADPKSTLQNSGLYAKPFDPTPLDARRSGNNPYQSTDNEAATPRATEDDQPLAWQRDALCSQTDPEAFFPEKGGSTRDAKRVCVSCDVRDICLQYALDNDERFGIWGGLSERERRKLKKRSA